jgi:hypothetical protein
LSETTLRGSLSELQLADVLQVLAVGNKSGQLHLSDGEARGSIFLSEGRIVHAQTNELAGEEAAYALAEWTRGEFRFAPGAKAPQASIAASYTSLLMEAARRSDEWRVIQRQIPTTDHVPEFVVPENPGESQSQINLNTREWQLLSKIDGRRSIKEIATASGMATFDAAKLLYGLVSTGLLRVKDTR